MTDTPKLNLRQKLVQIYNDLDHVEKAGENLKQHYKFVRAADVMRPIREVFAKYGIYAEPNFDYIGSYDIKTNSGGNMHTATVKATIKLYDTDSDETKTISGLGDGADSGDKGIYKAQTGAMKNALRNGALLPDEGDPNGGDPEADGDVDSRTSGTYSHNSSTTEIPDFQDAQRGPATTPKAQKPAEARPTPAPAASGATSTAGPSNTSPAAPVAAPSTPEQVSAGAAASASPEHGDAYEGPDDNGALPTEAELTVYRQKFSKLGDDLSTTGKLKSSKSLPINRKLLVFLISVTKATDAKNITTAQWENFFARVDAAVQNPEVGLVGLTKLVNKANGLEEKK